MKDVDIEHLQAWESLPLNLRNGARDLVANRFGFSSLITCGKPETAY
jgi:hypothetical protein